MADQAPELLNFNNKQENNGENNRGRLTANEFNQVVDAVNNNTTNTYALQQQVGGISFSVQASEAEYDALTTKDENTVYLILEE